MLEFETGQEYERLSIALYSEQAYLDYAMYVILDRALPFIGDGLKPVQRRIIYAMAELGLDSGSGYKKSARTVGDVIGKFHPHGDSAVYESMVLMSQSFSTRYPLIDGQGNWGSADDPKSFAAMRYTEAKLTAYTGLLLQELDKDTGIWNPNFDDTLREPAVLPAQVPHILLGGITGIAVGMATDIPPHNLNEVVAACIHLLDHPKADSSELLRFVKGPDLPSGATVICTPQDLKKIYSSGRGAVATCARWRQEEGNIVIDALPWQASGSRILEQIADLMVNKKMPLIQELRDESDHEQPTRMVIIPRSKKVNARELMDELFATTELAKNCRVNFNFIGLNGLPGVHSLAGICRQWLTFRRQVVRLRLSESIKRIQARTHILNGFLNIFLNLDEVIAIIRQHDKPKQALIQRFELSDDQVEAVLSIRLRQLARLEEIKIRKELEELLDKQSRAEKILSSERRLTRQIKKELQAAAQKYGDERRSKVLGVPLQSQPVAVDRTPREPITVILSRNGWIRSAKGHDTDLSRLNWRSGDSLLCQISTYTNQSMAVLDSSGRAYTLRCSVLPSARGFGEPLASHFKAPSGVSFIALMANQPYYLMNTVFGRGFIVKLEDLLGSRRTAGKTVVKLAEGDQLLPPAPWSAELQQALVAVCSSDRRLLIFSASELPIMTSGKGVKLIGLPPSAKAQMLGAVMLGKDDQLVVKSGRGKRVFQGQALQEFAGKRGQRGRVVSRLLSVETISVRSDG